MAHEVRARIDTKVVAHKDLEITIKSNGEKVGRLFHKWTAEPSDEVAEQFAN